MSNPNSEKIAVITGTSSGIGLYTAVQLAQAGYKVIATLRDTTKAGKLQEVATQAGVELIIRPLDVQDEASITNCVQEIVSSYGHIDLLVNNAGAGFLGSLEQTSMEDLRRTMEVNFFGVWRMTQAVFPLMRAAKSGRIISVTSVGGVIGQPMNDAYCAAKFAVEGFMESLAPVAKNLGVQISLIEPGPVVTNFVDSVIATKPQMPVEQQAIYGPILDSYMAATEQVFAMLGQTSEEVAKIIVEAATTNAPHFRYTTSPAIRGLISRKFVDPDGDSIIAATSERLPKAAN